MADTNGFSALEWKALRRLSTPDKIQRFLDCDVAYNKEPNGPTIRSPRRGSSTAYTPTRAKLSREEPDAGNLHVRVCEGWGWRHPHLLGIASS